jgi:tetratricopeptide (TPR) repeat protein
VLTVLSHGEIFQNLRRFDPIDPFFPENVQELRDLALIEVVPLVAMDTAADSRDRATANDPSSPKLLIVPRSVRDYIRSLMSEEERRAIVDGALEIYFGSRWRDGKPSLQPLTKIVVWENGMSGVGNHHAVIVSALKNCLTRHNEQLFRRIFRIAEAYLDALRSADKFRDLQQASEELFRLLDTSGKRREAARVAYYHGLGLRMLNQSGESVRALEASLAYAPGEFTKDWYASVYINLALSQKALKDYSAAVKSAGEVLTRTEPASGTHYQARAIVAECNVDGKSKEAVVADLSLLEEEARKKGHTVAANNAALEIVELLSSPADQKKWLDKVIGSKGGSLQSDSCCCEEGNAADCCG